MTSGLIKLDNATKMLAEVKNIDDAKDLVDLAEAARVYAKQVKLGLEAQNHAAEIKLRAQRRAGEILDSMDKAEGAREPGTNRGTTRLQDDTASPTYAELDIEKRDAHQWQKIASMPEEKFEQHIEQKKSDEQELTTASLYREAIRESAADKPPAPPLPDDKYRIIYADPPWKYENFGVSVSEYYGGSERHYPAMDIEEIENLPVKDMIADDAVLFLWVTSPKLNQVWGIIEAWGFEYKTSFVWDKIKHNYGHYNSVRHEFLLICGRGKATPEVKQLYDSVQSIERSDNHSEKPEEFRGIIDMLYPSGKRIELFARKDIDGWDSWGNEV